MIANVSIVKKQYDLKAPDKFQISPPFLFNIDVINVRSVKKRCNQIKLPK